MDKMSYLDSNQFVRKRIMLFDEVRREGGFKLCFFLPSEKADQK
jgi:hypothetical protein